MKHMRHIRHRPTRHTRHIRDIRHIRHIRDIRHKRYDIKPQHVISLMSSLPTPCSLDGRVAWRQRGASGGFWGLPGASKRFYVVDITQLEADMLHMARHTSNSAVTALPRGCVRFNSPSHWKQGEGPPFVTTPPRFIAPPRG